MHKFSRRRMHLLHPWRIHRSRLHVWSYRRSSAQLLSRPCIPIIMSCMCLSHFFFMKSAFPHTSTCHMRINLPYAYIFSNASINLINLHYMIQNASINSTCLKSQKSHLYADLILWDPSPESDTTGSAQCYHTYNHAQLLILMGISTGSGFIHSWTYTKPPSLLSLNLHEATDSSLHDILVLKEKNLFGVLVLTSLMN